MKSPPMKSSRARTSLSFAVPGAFTPTCSAQHLPSFVDNADALKAKGVDSIVCLSVNDAFVMGAWGAAQNVGDTVLMVADGNVEFTQAVGLELGWLRLRPRPALAALLHVCGGRRCQAAQRRARRFLRREQRGKLLEQI